MASGEITQLLVRLQAGDQSAMNELIPLVLGELRAAARRRVARGRSDPTLNTTALVHEAYLKLQANDHPIWKDREHFFAVVATVLCQVAIDADKKRKRLKRVGLQVSVDDAESCAVPPRSEKTLDRSAAMARLRELSERMFLVVICRDGLQMTVPETATSLKISARTVKREHDKARRFLYLELHGTQRENA